MRLVEVCAFFNANHDRTGTRRRRPQVELIIDADTLTGNDTGGLDQRSHPPAHIDHRDVVV